MTKYILLIIIPFFAFADSITIAKAMKKPLGKIIQTNAQIIQLSNQQQKIVSRLSGHVEKYFVTTGDKVKKGDKIALIESIALSEMTADFISLKAQAKASKVQLSTTKKLYQKGLASKNELNKKVIALQEILAKQNTLSSQLHSLGVRVKVLQKATDKFILYAHADGVVGEILVPLHANVSAQTPLMSIVSREGYYAVAYLSMEDAMDVTSKISGFVNIEKKSYEAGFVQLMPTIDEETQRAKLLFTIKNPPKNMLLNAFVQMQISLEPKREAVMVKKSALSLFSGEWVVFMPVRDEKVSFVPHAVKIIDYFGDEVALKGIKEGSSYVSKGIYYVKSMLLKSVLAELEE